MNARATALIADDEPLLRDALRRQLATVWPELEIVGEARNGREAVRLFDERHPDICFLDVILYRHPEGLRVAHLDARTRVTGQRVTGPACRNVRTSANEPAQWPVCRARDPDPRGDVHVLIAHRLPRQHAKRRPSQSRPVERAIDT